MPAWRSLLLNLYYHSSRPVRWWNHRTAVRKGRAPLVVVYYHRVAEDLATPWTVSPKMFARQMRWLRERFEMVSLEEVQRRVRSGANRTPAVSITFDDGYSDNCREAIPLLVREHIPCTYFVTVKNVLDGQPFNHDRMLGKPAAPNTMDQLRAMAAAGIEIGAHTYTHADLGKVRDCRVLHQEMVTAGEELQAALGRQVRYFAFPFGRHANLTGEAFDLAYEAGYEGVCSAYGGLNYPGDDAFHIQRVPADESMIRLINWVTGDPRKLHIPRFQYETTPKPEAPTLATNHETKHGTAEEV
jgi:peptidoglycan/xylan/chitin deacetylase (PgdA/CDA1 family)